MRSIVLAGIDPILRVSCRIRSDRINHLPIEQLESLGEALLDFGAIDRAIVGTRTIAPYSTTDSQNWIYAYWYDRSY